MERSRVPGVGMHVPSRVKHRVNTCQCTGLVVHAVAEGGFHQLAIRAVPTCAIFTNPDVQLKR